MLAYYNGKLVTVLKPEHAKHFSIACYRVTDNAKEGYVIDGGKVFYVRTGTGTAVLLKGEERAKVLAEIEAICPHEFVKKGRCTECNALCVGYPDGKREE